MESLKAEACAASLSQPAAGLTSPPSSCFLLTGHDTCYLSESERSQKEVSVIQRCLLEGSNPPHVLPETFCTLRSGRNYRLSEPEVKTVHLHQREGLQRGFLLDLGLHAVADVSGPNHLEAQRLAPRRRDEGAPQVDALADELRRDHWSGRQGRDGS